MNTYARRQIIETPALAAIRNGDIESYNVLWELLFKPNSAFSQIVKTIDLTFPYVDSLEERANLLKFQIQTVAGVHQFSKEGKGIGSPIATLTINPAKIVTYSPV
jgi:hypothetical protein